MITVKDVWRGILPPTTELLGGGAGLDRRVEWATSLRTRPPAFESLKGGELAFVPIKGIRLLDERLDLAAVMTSLAEKGGVAVAVTGDVSADSITVADRMMLPLLKLPDRVHLPDIQQATVRFILEQRTLIHDRQQEMQAELMQLALTGAGARAIVERLGTLTALPVFWHTDSAEPIAVMGAAPSLVAELGECRGSWERWAATSAAAAEPAVQEFRLAGDRRAVVAVIPGRRGAAGVVGLVVAGDDGGQLERVAVARAAAALAVEIDRERAVLRARDDLEGEVLSALVGGTYSSERSIMERASRLGVDITGSNAVLVLRTPVGGAPTGDAVFRAVSLWFQRRAVGGLVAPRDGGICALVPLGAGGETALRRDAERLREDCLALGADGQLTIAISRPGEGAAAVRRAYREAEQALGMGIRLLGPGRVVAFSGLGLHRLLLAMQQHAELTDYYRDTLGPLVRYDRRTGSELVATLDAYFECLCSPTDTAARLGAHRNTVLYRMRRIEEIVGVTLSDARARFDLQLCLRIREVMEAMGQ